MISKKVSLTFLTLIMLFSLTFGLCFLLKPSVNVKAENGADIVINDDFTNKSVANSFIEKNNLATDGNGHATFGFVPGNAWDGHVSGGDGYLIYEFNADNEYYLNSLSFSLNVGIGHHGGLYYYQTSISDVPGYDWEEKGHKGYEFTTNLILYISFDKTNWTSVYDLNNKNLGADKRSPSSKDEAITINDQVLSSALNMAEKVYVKIYVKHPTYNGNDLPITSDRFSSGIALGDVGVNLYSVNFSLTQKKNDNQFTDNFGNNKGTNIKENYAHIVDKRDVYDGNALFALIPSASWGGFVLTSENSYVVYKLSSASGKVFSGINFSLDFKLLKDANLIIELSYNGEDFFEIYNAVDLLGDSAYNNPLTRKVNNETLPYQKLELNLNQYAENNTDIYIKINLKCKVETLALQSLKVELFSVNFSYKMVQKPSNSVFINYVLNGGQNNADNRKIFQVGTGTVVLKEPIKYACEFLGWYDNPSFSGQKITEISIESEKTYCLYAKWTLALFTFSFNVIGNGKIFVNGSEVNGQIKINEKTDAEIVLAPLNNNLVYGLTLNETDLFLKDGKYTVENVNKDLSFNAKFIEKESINDDFYIDYTDNTVYGNKWKEKIFDFSNLYITNATNHALGVNNGEGYIVYRFLAENGKVFSGADITLGSMLFDYNLHGTNEKLNFYVSYDNVSYEKVYSGTFKKSQYDTIVCYNVSSFINGRTELYFKIELGSNNEWAYLKSLDIDFSFETVKTVIDYGGLYKTESWLLEKGEKFDSNLIVIKDGFSRLDDKIYTDKDYLNEFNPNDKVIKDLHLFIKVEGTCYNVNYVLFGGENNGNNPTSFTYNGNDIVLYAPTKFECEFLGWYLDENMEEALTDKVYAKFKGDITLYAKFKSLRFSINYVTFDGENNGNNPTSYLHGGEDIVLYNPTRQGYNFVGWYLDENMEEALTDKVYAKFKGDITLYAKWNKVQEESKGGCKGNLEGDEIGVLLVLCALSVVAIKKIYKRKENR